MTAQEFSAKVGANEAARVALLDRIANAALAVVPVLLDAGRVNSAKELQELLFQLEALQQENDSLMKANMDAVFELLRRARDRLK